MHTPDLEADWRAAKRILEAAKVLVAYLETDPTPPPRLSDRLTDVVTELMHPDVARGAFPEATTVAVELANWAAKCGAAIESPWNLELDE